MKLYSILIFFCLIRFTSQGQKLKPFAATDGKCGYKNELGAEVIKPQFERAKSYSEGLGAVKLNGNWGFIDSTGKVVIPFKYSVAGFFYEGLAGVLNSDKKGGFIDKSGNEVIPFIYEDPGEGFLDGIAEVILNGRKIKIDKSGKEINNNINNPKNINTTQGSKNPYSGKITTKGGFTWEFPDDGFKIDSSDVEKSYVYTTPLKDGSIIVKLADMNKLNKQIRNTDLYTLSSLKIKELKADGYDVKGIEVNEYLKSLKADNLVLGFLAQHAEGDILFFYTHKDNYVFNWFMVNYNSKFPIVKKDFDTFLNSIHFKFSN